MISAQALGSQPYVIDTKIKLIRFVTISTRSMRISSEINLGRSNPKQQLCRMTISNSGDSQLTLS